MCGWVIVGRVFYVVCVVCVCVRGLCVFVWFVCGVCVSLCLGVCEIEGCVCRVCMCVCWVCVWCV